MHTSAPTSASQPAPAPAPTPAAPASAPAAPAPMPTPAAPSYLAPPLPDVIRTQSEGVVYPTLKAGEEAAFYPEEQNRPTYYSPRRGGYGGRRRSYGYRSYRPRGRGGYYGGYQDYPSEEGYGEYDNYAYPEYPAVSSSSYCPGRI